MQTSIATVSLAGGLAEKLEATAAAGFTGVEIFESDLLSFNGSPKDVARMMADLGLTSGKTLELVLELEDHLDIQIDVEDITPDDLNTITTLAAFVATHVVAED